MPLHLMSYLKVLKHYLGKIFCHLMAQFPVAGKSIKSTLYSTPDCQAITKKAIVNRLREYYHRPASVPLAETGALFQLEVALLKDHVMVTLDTTGPSLFKRGYRLEKGALRLKKIWQQPS